MERDQRDILSEPSRSPVFHTVLFFSFVSFCRNVCEHKRHPIRSIFNLKSLNIYLCSVFCCCYCFSSIPFLCCCAVHPCGDCIIPMVRTGYRIVCACHRTLSQQIDFVGVLSSLIDAVTHDITYEHTHT